MEIEQININDELHQNFIDFSYEANSQRAFADARDGLKPGQRACLWEMYDKGYSSSKPHVKSAKVSGGVVAAWWPHGTVSIYDTFARMSQKWINNIPEVDFHGANGSQIISGEAAADRYTEVRLSKATEDGLFIGIKKSSVPMIKNFSEDAEWPEVLPALMPRLMVNGCQGIGVTIANCWLPHNLKEVGDIIIDYIQTNNLDYSKLAPDFPSGGVIINKNELSPIYETGKGKVILRAKTEIKKNSIFITEFPYQVYIEPWIDEVKKLVNNEVISGIEDIYNRSSSKGILVEIECSKSPQFILNQLFKETDLQKSFSANQWALIGKTPKLLNLKEYLTVYIQHNLTCIINENKFDLAKAEDRLEIVNGLLKALEDIDNIISLIKQSESSKDAKNKLIKKYNFSEKQADAIIKMRLGSLAHLESVELNKEAVELNNTINNCNNLIQNENLQKEEFIKRLKDYIKKYGDARRTELTQIDIKPEDKEVINVEPEKVVVIMTESGLIKRVPASSFRTQRRGGKGVKTADDVVNAVIRTNTVDSLMIFSDKGNMYRLLVDSIPEGTNTTKGISVKNLIQVLPNENPTVIYSIYRDTDAKYVLFTTKNGLVKKTALDEYTKTRKKTGIAAITLRENDSIASVSLIKDEPIIMITKRGMCIKFNSSEITPTARATSGVKGINLNENDEVITTLVVRDNSDMLGIFSTGGFGKKIAASDLVLQHRGGKGVICYKGEDAVAAGTLLSDTDNILIIGLSNSICIPSSDLPILNRPATGNIVIKDRIQSVSKV